MWDKLLDLGVSAFKGDPQAKDRAQVQLEKALEKRFDTSLALWAVLWTFAMKAESRDVKRDDLKSLADALETFLQSSGILVSFDCLKALLQLRSDIAETNAFSDDTAFLLSVPKVYQNLLPHTEKRGNKAIESPGILMLLREQVGSNMNSVSSVL